MSITDIRKGLASDEKHGGGSSLVVVKVIRVICGGRRGVGR
jgi:hypothetical protein